MKNNFSVHKLFVLLFVVFSLTKGGPGITDGSASLKKEISEINIHLPVSPCSKHADQSECRHVKHELSASNGCYQW